MKYNISKASDMSKFEADIKLAILAEAKSQIRKRSFDVTCPHCKSDINIAAEVSKCPNCGQEINLHLDFDF